MPMSSSTYDDFYNKSVKTTTLSGQKINVTTDENGRIQPLSNPLSLLSSYTYNVSLYMVTGDVANQFTTSGGTLIMNGNMDGVRVVARSGGISDSEKSLVGLDKTRKDYYIDDFTVTTYLPGPMPHRASTSVEVKFKIIEPYGFAFLQNMTNAGLELNGESGEVFKKMNGVQQHFIIGVTFKGYDADGKIIESPVTMNGEKIGDRNFLIRIAKVKFKLDGKSVVYNCEAYILSDTIANGQINGTLQSSTTLSGRTVGEVLADPKNDKSLVSVLNSMGEINKDTGRVSNPVKYSIEFLDADGNVDTNSEIAKQRLIDDAAFDSKIAGTFDAKSKEKSTIKEQLSSITYDPNKALVQLTNGQSILTIIDNIITKSTYITSALTEINTPGVETETKNNTSAKTLTWYSVNPVVRVKEPDPIKNDWAYDITFQIKKFEVPYVRMVTAAAISTYQGPFRKYNYWLTGENSEILSYEQQYDNLYYMMSVMGRNEADSRRPTGNTPVAPSNGVMGDPNGSEGNNFKYSQNAAAQLYSPGDNSRVKIKIIGDPDYIMTMLGVNGVSKSISGSNFQLNPLNGQAFIEINFAMASDYKDDGLMDISGQIQFSGSNKDHLKIKGVVYKIIRIDSSFSKGSFTQTLDMVIVDQSHLVMASKSGDVDNTAGVRENQSTSTVGGNQTDATLARAGVTPNKNGGRAGIMPDGIRWGDPRTAQAQNGNTSAGQGSSLNWDSVIKNKNKQINSSSKPLDDMALNPLSLTQYIKSNQTGR